MTLSVFVFDITRVQDIILGFFKGVIERIASIFFVEEDQQSKETEEKPVDNNSPPFQETLGVSITEQVKTKEALA